MYTVEFTPEAQREVLAQFARSGFAVPCLMIERLGPRGEVTRSSDGEPIWKIERPYPLCARVIDLQPFDERPKDVSEVKNILVWLHSVRRPGELGVTVSIRDRQLFVEACVP
jgi:hypothetical protein